MYPKIKYFIIELIFLVILLNQISIPYIIFIPGTNAVIEDISMVSTFSEDILLSINDLEYSQHVEPTLAISENDTIFSGWKNAYSHNGGGVRVSFSKSIDGGASWSEPFDMPMFEGIYTGQSDPWLVWSDEIIYYAYLEYSINTNEISQITVAISNNLGKTWSIIAATNADGFADKETMAVSSNGTIYVVYDDIIYNETEELSYVEVRLSRSIDNGLSFDEITVLTDSILHPIDHVGPYITSNGDGGLYISWFWIVESVWGDIYLKFSNDGGKTFSSPIDINPNSQNGTYELDADNKISRTTLPIIKFDQNNRLYVLWAEKFETLGEWDIYMRYSDNLGLNWSSRYQINPDISGDQWQPDMDIDSQGRLHIVYYSEQGNFFRPLYQLITFNGSNQDNIVISNAIPITDVLTPNLFTRPGDYFTVRVDSKDIPHVVWSDGRDGEMDIYYSHGEYQQSSSLPKKTDLSFFWLLALFFAVILWKSNKKSKL